MTFTPKTEDVRVLIYLASTESLEVNVPALFLGISKNGIGILSNFLKVSLLNLRVSLSPTIVIKNSYNVQSIMAAIPINKNHNAIL